MAGKGFSSEITNDNNELKAILENNKNGDAEISDTREYLGLHALNVFLDTIKSNLNIFSNYNINQAVSLSR